MQTVTKTPIALIAFNRPELTRRVFERIRDARPERLLLVSDGPRNENEAKIVAEVRAIAEAVDWPCTVEKNYSEKNMGTKDRVFSGIEWVFNLVDRAIILEDDCVPDPTFFPFCEEILERFKDDSTVMHIGGSCNQVGNRKFSCKESYYAALIPNTCGWATWKRAWKLYDPNLSSWPTFKASGELARRFDNPGAYERFSLIWDKYHAGTIHDAWDGQWTYAVISNGGMALHPKTNLITNIGNGSGVHPNRKYKFGDLPTTPLIFPLVHPTQLMPNKAADDYTYRHEFNIDATLWKRLIRPLKNAFPGLLSNFRKIKGAKG